MMLLTKIVKSDLTASCCWLFQGKFLPLGLFPSYSTCFFKCQSLPVVFEFLSVSSLKFLRKFPNFKNMEKKKWKMDSGICCQFSSQDAKAKLFGDECRFCQCWLWAVWSQRLLETAGLNVSNVIWLTKESKGTCMKIVLSYKHVCKAWARKD